MHHLILLLAAAALLSQSQVGRAANVNRKLKLFSDVDNSLERHGLLPSKHNSMKNFLRLMHRPPTSIQHEDGRAVELTCDAIGSPAPTIQWLRNNEPILEYDQGSSEYIETKPRSLARLTSTLIISRPTGNERDVYTCLVSAGSKNEISSTVVHNIESNQILSERIKLIPLAPKIVVTYKVFMDTIGSNIVLPCKAKGHPRPMIMWYDNNGEIVPKISNRMKVLKSGELLISHLRWSDMGEFTCRASNMFGIKTASTFVYPAKAG